MLKFRNKDIDYTVRQNQCIVMCWDFLNEAHFIYER